MLNDWKKIALPSIEDWTQDQNHIRFSKDIKKLDLFEWLFCHPTAFKLIWYKGVTFLLLLNTAVVGYIAYRNNSLLALIPGLIFGVLAVREWWKNRKLIKLDPNITFYDLHLKE